MLNATVPPVNTVTITTPTDGDVNTTDECAGLVDPTNLDMGAIRAAAFANTPPHIIECAAAVRQKGATIWMTGCSGAGKTTIATALEDILVKETRVQLRRRQFADGIESRFDILRSRLSQKCPTATTAKRYIDQLHAYGSKGANEN